MFPTHSDEGLHCCDACGTILWHQEEVDHELCMTCWQDLGFFHCAACGAITNEVEAVMPLCQACDKRLEAENTEYLAGLHDAPKAEDQGA